MFTICENNDSKDIFKLENKIFSDSGYTLNQIEDINTLPEMYKIMSVKNDEGELAGYVIVFNNSASLEIMKIGVDPKFREQGFGSILLNEVKKSRMEIFLEVRESNKKAINFYKKNYFKEVGKRKNYYRDTNEAAVLMSFSI